MPVNARGNIDRYRAIVQLSYRLAQIEIKDTMNEVKCGCLYLRVEVFIKVMNGLVMTLCKQFWRFANGRTQTEDWGPWTTS